MAKLFAENRDGSCYGVRQLAAAFGAVAAVYDRRSSLIDSALTERRYSRRATIPIPLPIKEARREAAGWLATAGSKLKKAGASSRTPKVQS